MEHRNLQQVLRKDAEDGLTIRNEGLYTGNSHWA